MKNKKTAKNADIDFNNDNVNNEQEENEPKDELEDNLLEHNVPVVSSESNLASYLDKISKFPYLTQEEEETLAKDWVDNGNVKSAHKLVTSHLRLVAKIAYGFRGYGLPLLELISEGNIGLMHAVKRFDPNKGFRLSTYAMWWIKAAIQEYVLHSWSLVKIGTTAAQKKLFFSLRKVKNRLKKVDNSNLTKDEIAEIASRLDVSEKEVIEMDSRLTQADKSLNVLIGDSEDGHEMIDFLPAKEENQENSLISKDDLKFKRALFVKAFALLTDREREVITKRRLDEPQITLEDLSQHYKISRERVRQIENRALEKLQNFVHEYLNKKKALPAD